MSARTPSERPLGAKVVRALSSARDARGAADAVLREVALALGAPLALVWLLDGSTGLLRCRYDWGEGPAVDELREVGRRLSFAPGVGFPGRVLETLAPAWVQDITQDPNFPRDELTGAAGLRGVIGVPLVSSDGPMGVLEVFGRAPREPSPGELEDVAMAARQLAAYLSRLRIEDRLRVSEEAAASIVNAALDCIITMDHRGRVVDFNPAAEATFGHDRDAAIGELLADLIIPPAMREAHQEALTRYVADRRPTILGRRLELEGMRADGSTFPCELTVTRVGLSEPPVFAGFVRDITSRRAADAELERLLASERDARARAEAAEQAALEVAEALQHSLLPPRLPEIPGLQLGAAYRGGTVGWQVGGDFYDVFAVGPGRWAIAIGDVCGKGPRAASLTAAVRYALRYAAVREGSPAAVLQTVNDELLRDSEGEFCTAIFAVVDLDGAAPAVCMSVAGHPLPVLAHPDGSTGTVGRPGPLVGAFPQSRFEETAFDLGPGDLLVLYTDGVTEAPIADGRFGEPRLAELVAGSVLLHPQQVAERIDRTVSEERRPVGADDVAVLALRAAGP